MALFQAISIVVILVCSVRLSYEWLLTCFRGAGAVVALCCSMFLITVTSQMSGSLGGRGRVCKWVIAI